MFSSQITALFLRAPPCGQQRGRPAARECWPTLVRAPPAPPPGVALASNKRFIAEHRALPIISAKEGGAKTKRKSGTPWERGNL